MSSKSRTKTQLLLEIDELKRRLAESEDTLEAIRDGEVDAIVVSGKHGEKIFSLESVDYSYRVMFETIIEGAVTLDGNGTIVFANAAFAALTGKNVSVITGTRFIDLFPRPSQLRFNSYLQECSIHPCREEFSISCPHDTFIPVSISGTVVSGAGMHTICLIVSDLSERKAAEQKLQEAYNEIEKKVVERTAELIEINTTLRESESRFRSVLDNSSDVLYRVNFQTGCYEYISPAAEKIVGYTSRELMANDRETAISMIHPDDIPSMRAAIALLKETGKASLEYRQRTKKGDYRWLSNHMTVARDNSGRIVYRDGTIRDITELKKVEEELLKSRYRLEAVFATIPDIIVEFDVNGIIVRANDAAFKCAGVNPLNHSAQQVLEIMKVRHLDGRDLKIEESTTYRALRGETVEDEVYMIRNRFGKKRVVATYAAPLYIDGVISGAVALWHDITEHKRAEETLRQSEYKFSMVFRAVPVGISLTSISSGRIFDVNKAWLDIAGIAHKKEVIGKTHMDLGLLPEPQEWVSILNEFNQKGIVRNVEVDIFTSAKMLRTILVNVESIDINGRTFMLSTIEDITERKLVEDALRESDERFRALAENIPDLIMRFDRNLRINYVNMAVCKRTGLSHDILAGMSVGENSTSPEATAYWEKNMQSVFDTGIAQKLEYSNTWRNDTRIYDAHMIPEIDACGEVRAVIAIAHDVTSLKKTEEALRLSNTLLNDRNAELDAFNYSVSHDLRGPLNIISMFRELLWRDFSEKLDDHGKLYLQHIDTATHRIGQIINDLQKLTQISRTGIFRTKVNLSEIVHELSGELKLYPSARDVTFVIDDGIFVFADSGLIKIVMENIIRNAWKFTSKQPNPCIEFSSQEDDGRIICRMRDNGVGFDSKLAGEVFKPFRRLHSEEEFPGTGIGLAIVHRIIERHGGKVWAEGEVGKGASFYFELPDIN